MTIILAIFTALDIHVHALSFNAQPLARLFGTKVSHLAHRLLDL
jgi:hypothetical protein